MGIEYHMDLIQHTDEWLRTRLGLITASQMKLLVTEKTLKTADNDKVRTLIYQLACERITKEIDDNFQSWEMMRGQKEEALALRLYAEHYNKVKTCGFITNDSLGFTIGMSPDGLVGEDGGVEAKSRRGKYQVQTITEGVTPSEYMAQVQGFFLVSDRKWCDFISYSNGMHMFVKTEEPNADWQGALKEAVTDAEKKIVEMVEGYKAKIENLHQAPWIDVMSEEMGVVKSSRNIDPADALMAG